jgi:hypothetical protein
VGTAALGCSVEQSSTVRAAYRGGSSFCESSNQLEVRSAPVGRVPAAAVGCPGLRRWDRNWGVHVVVATALVGRGVRRHCSIRRVLVPATVALRLQSGNGSFVLGALSFKCQVQIALANPGTSIRRRFGSCRHRSRHRGRHSAGGRWKRSPAPGSRNRNDESLVMKFVYRKTSTLLEGDSERRSEQRFSEEQPQADLLKVAHHGSATSTIPQLLTAVHPDFALISVGARNTYGHPRGDVLARLAAAHVLTYRTDLDGAVTFYLDGQTVSAVLP